jgi:UDP-N-acetylglucosamine:LPS N-acetylglucosamine transferase
MTGTGGHRILAVASAGGHWQQLMLMRPAFEGAQTLFVTTLAGLPEQHGITESVIVPDCNRNDRLGAIRNAIAMRRVIRRYRPDVVISTGALPGVIALAFGRLHGARTIWVDSVANAEEMSLSGRLARRLATLWMSQWPHVADATGAEYAGSVL